MSKKTTRFEILDLMDRRLDGLAPILGAEVGTDQGVYASQLLAAYPCLHLITVDPWLTYDEIRDDRTYARKQFKLNMAGLEQRHTHVEATSVRAASYLAALGRSFHFVYVDAAHDAVSVAQDLCAWWPLVKPGGMMAGHDFDLPSVSSTVVEFCARNRLDLHVLNEHGGPDTLGHKKGSGMDRNGGWAHPSWYFFKEQP